MLLRPGQAAAHVIATGNVNSYRQLYLVVDNQVVCQVEANQIPLILISAYFVFNVWWVAPAPWRTDQVQVASSSLNLIISMLVSSFIKCKDGFGVLVFIRLS